MRPAYTTYCDSAAVVQLSASETRTRHLSIRSSWLHRLVQHKSVSMQCAPTYHKSADILTKRLNAYVHEDSCRDHRLWLCNGQWPRQLKVHGIPAEEVEEQVNDRICLLRVVPFSIMPFATWRQTWMPCSLHTICCIVACLSECVCVLLYCCRLPVYRGGCLILHQVST